MEVRGLEHRDARVVLLGLSHRIVVVGGIRVPANNRTPLLAIEVQGLVAGQGPGRDRRGHRSHLDDLLDDLGLHLGDDLRRRYGGRRARRKHERDNHETNSSSEQGTLHCLLLLRVIKGRGTDSRTCRLPEFTSLRPLVATAPSIGAPLSHSLSRRFDGTINKCEWPRRPVPQTAGNLRTLLLVEGDAALCQDSPCLPLLVFLPEKQPQALAVPGVCPGST